MTARIAFACIVSAVLISACDKRPETPKVATSDVENTTAGGQSVVLLQGDVRQPETSALPVVPGAQSGADRAGNQEAMQTSGQ